MIVWRLTEKKIFRPRTNLYRNFQKLIDQQSQPIVEIRDLASKLEFCTTVQKPALGNNDNLLY